MRDRAVHRLDVLAADAEPEPEAARAAGAVAAPEAIEDARELIGGNAVSGVGDRHAVSVLVLDRRQLDCAAFRRVLERVADEADEDLVEDVGIGECDDRRRPRCHAAGLGERLHQIGDVREPRLRAEPVAVPAGGSRSPCARA